MDPTAMSFEAKIAMALGGSSWQKLQGTKTEEPGNMIEKVAGGAVQEEEGGQNLQNVETGESGNMAGNVPEEVAQEQEDEYDDDDDDDDDDEILLMEEDAEVETEEARALREARERKLQKKTERFRSTIARDAGEVIETIPVEALNPVPHTIAWDSDPELLCCYNWQASTDGTNTIFVPGEPQKWQQRPLPHTLEPDSGYTAQDYNYARQPRNPYSPMFHALSVMKPRYNFHDVDILADRNNLRVLLEFAQGKSNGPFRLNVFLVFNTLVIVRRESRWWKRSDGNSCGFTFEKHFTKTADDMADATSHYRAIRYKMGPLNVVCRFEADAYDDGIVPDHLTPSEAEAVNGGLDIRPSFNYSAPIRVLQKGHIVPTAQMLELKTQAYHPEGTGTVQCQDQLWFGRTALLFTAPYEKATCTVKRIKKEDARERVRRWEQNQQGPLRKLVALLGKLRDVLRRERRPNRAVVLVRESKGGPILLRTMEERSHAVDRETRERFWPLGQQQNRGRGGGGGAGAGAGRAGFNAPRGRGQVGNGPVRGESSHPRGRGGFVPPPSRRGDHYSPRGRGALDAGSLSSPCGRAYDERGTSPSRSRRGRGRGGRGSGRGGGGGDRGGRNPDLGRLDPQPHP
ncbi:geranylgeranyl pyrophosphate synthetase [Stemphylium lycopersici]|uniref:Geranylgeranyl pyrophosphate synthetase n=1 Tax=Stemphylium lycopersici TaxID=183478 RepID=A0A364MUE4_STELY|nr:geranylgeranyl pyrophosphate synthetase [Stemphylium lycopersici]RAR03998.1 geranylgeranyl pyrophosphate synthetase [Stemphylium lycopersici]